MKYNLQLEGLHCEACKKITERNFKRIEGVEEAIVNLDQQTAEVVTTKDIPQDDFFKALEGTEYKVKAVMEN